MWSIAIYDDYKKELILSRDRFGKKPLYYHLNENFIIFSSEPKAIFHHPKVTKKVNIRKCSRYAGGHYRHIDNDNETFFDNLYQIRPGTYSIFNKQKKIITSKFWSLQKNSELSKKFHIEDIKKQFINLLNDSVKIRLRSDVPLGTMLSGGMDSTSMTALAYSQNKNLHSFSSISKGKSFDESEYIDAFLEKVPVNHSYISPSEEDLVTTLNKMLVFYDEPICTVTWFSLFTIASEIAKTDIRVVLTGHGGDELLAGYWDHFHYHWYDLKQQNIEINDEVNSWQNNHKRDRNEIVYFENMIKKPI